ncbi:MAG: hypothetical protein JXR78_17435 [Victivallales bacterium]|nr:hypothetical protein [Victivallales bacterium]
MKMYKSLSIVVAMLGVSLSIASASDIQEKKDIAEIVKQSENFKNTDPYFAQWLKGQAVILENILTDIDVDSKSGMPDSTIQIKSQKADFKFMLDKITAEIDFFSKTTAPEQRFNVKDFGAVGDGKTDDGSAIRQAIATAASQPGTSVFIPKGKYRIGGCSTRRKVNPYANIPGGKDIPGTNSIQDGHLVLVGLKNLTIEGEKETELVFSDAISTAIRITDCTNVRLRNLKISYATVPYCHGKISKLVDKETFEVVLDPGSKMPDESFFKRAQTGGLLRFFSETIKSDDLRPEVSSIAPHASRPVISKTGDNTYSFKINGSHSVLKSYRRGMHFALYARTYGNHAIINFSSNRTRLENITINTSSAMAILNHFSDLPFIINCVIEALPGSYVSTSADAIYFRDCGLGGLLNGNKFYHVGDDFLNIHSYMRPAFRQDNNIIYIPVGMFNPDFVRPGYRLGSIKSSLGHMNVGEETEISAVEIVKGNGKLAGVDLSYQYKITCKTALPKLITMEDVGDAQNRIPDMLVIMEAQSHGGVISNNIFKDGLSRMLIGGRNWLFFNNKVIDTLDHYQLVHFGPEPNTNIHGGEGFQPRNITFSDNNFNCISKTVFNFSSRINRFFPEMNTIASSHIRIINNRIKLEARTVGVPVLRIEQAENIIFSGNEVEVDVPVNTPFAKLKFCRNITITNNKIPASFGSIAIEDSPVTGLKESNNRNSEQ